MNVFDYDSTSTFPNSAAIEQAWHNSAGNLVMIKFTEGYKYYIHEDVHQSEFEDFVNAPSAGAFYAGVIRPKCARSSFNDVTPVYVPNKAHNVVASETPVSENTDTDMSLEFVVAVHGDPVGLYDAILDALNAAGMDVEIPSVIVKF